MLARSQFFPMNNSLLQIFMSAPVDLGPRKALAGD